MSGHFEIDPLASFIYSWLDKIITGEEPNNNWIGPLVGEEEEKEEDNFSEFDNFSEYGITSDTFTEIVMGDDEWRDGITSIVRETCENEGSDVYDKAYARCLADVNEKYDNTCNSIREELGNTEECLALLNDEKDLYNAKLKYLDEMVWADLEEFNESTRGPVENTTVENTAPFVNDTSLVEDTAPVEDTETKCPAPDSVPSSPAAIATGQYTYTVAILESNLGVGSYRGLASGTQAEALTSVSTSAVNDPVSKRNYEEYLDSYTESEADKGNKRVKTGSESEPTGDAS